MNNLRRFSTGLAAASLVLSLSTGIASASPVAAPTPTEPMPITVHPKTGGLANNQPPVEWTVWAAPHAIIPQGKSALNLGRQLPSFNQQDFFGNPYRYSDFFSSQTACTNNIQWRTPVQSGNIILYWSEVAKHKGEQVRTVYCYQIANGKWVYEYTQYGDPDRGESVRR